MYARWDFNQDRQPYNPDTDYDPPNWIRIRGDRQSGCTDCKCYCRCLCISYISSDFVYERAIACEKYVGEDYCDRIWEVELGGHLIQIFMNCLGCPDASTKLTLIPPAGTTLVTQQSVPIVCPDLIQAEWSIHLDDSETPETAAISVECLKCGDTCELLGTQVPCCPERDNLPYILHATIEAEAGPGCFPLVGLEFSLVLDSGNPAAPGTCWRGSVPAGPNYVPVNPGDECTVNLAVACFSDGLGNDTWRAGNSTNGCGGIDSGTAEAIEVVSCDPLELVFTIQGEGCCNDKFNDYGIDGSYTVRITE
jgi:hypothetical protein